jgi:uncharacterized protein (DUF433 family)
MGERHRYSLQDPRPPRFFLTSGVAYISGTRTKVLEIALDRIAHHWDADEIQRQHPQLKLGQIYGALAHYADHQEELDKQIEEQVRFVESSRAAASITRAYSVGQGRGSSCRPRFGGNVPVRKPVQVLPSRVGVGNASVVACKLRLGSPERELLLGLKSRRSRR